MDHSRWPCLHEGPHLTCFQRQDTVRGNPKSIGSHKPAVGQIPTHFWETNFEPWISFYGLIQVLWRDRHVSTVCSHPFSISHAVIYSKFRKDEAVRLWDCTLALEEHPLCRDRPELQQKVEFLKSTAEKLQPKILPPSNNVPIIPFELLSVSGPLGYLNAKTYVYMYVISMLGLYRWRNWKLRSANLVNLGIKGRT